MNRKKASKIKKQVAESVNRLHPYDDPNNWLTSDFQESPWPKEKIADFQKQIDSAFGGENAIVLVWSGDRSYGDAFYTDWFPNGAPKGRLERKPVLLFGEFKVNEKDYLYLSCPRWVLMEVQHASQLEASWEESSWVDDNASLGGRKRIRPEKPPKYFYTHLRTLADHEHATFNGIPACCERMWRVSRRICYGKYREPNEQDIAYVRNIRERMDRDGVAQRNDQKRSAKVLQRAQIATKHFMEQASLRKAEAVKELMMANSGPFFQSILDQVGSTMSPKERDAIVSQALDEQDAERFSRNTTI